MMNGQVKIQGLPISINCLPIVNRYFISMCVKFAEIEQSQYVTNCAADTHQTFWRPKALEKASMQNPWQHKVP